MNNKCLNSNKIDLKLILQSLILENVLIILKIFKRVEYLSNPQCLRELYLEYMDQFKLLIL
jgi:hypothetical protein